MYFVILGFEYGAELTDGLDCFHISIMLYSLLFVHSFYMSNLLQLQKEFATM